MSESHSQIFACRRLGAAIIKRAIDDLSLPQLCHSGHRMEENRAQLIQDTFDWFDSPSEHIGSYKWALSLTYISPNTIRKHIEKLKQEKGILSESI